jgi:hypothetical protein
VSSIPSYFKFACPECAGHLEAEEQWIGQRIDCPHCGQVVAIPSPATTAPVPPLAPLPVAVRAGASRRWLLWGLVAAAAAGLLVASALVLGLGLGWFRFQGGTKARSVPTASSPPPQTGPAGTDGEARSTGRAQPGERAILEAKPIEAPSERDAGTWLARPRKELALSHCEVRVGANTAPTLLFPEPGVYFDVFGRLTNAGATSYQAEGEGSLLVALSRSRREQSLSGGLDPTLARCGARAPHSYA